MNLRLLSLSTLAATAMAAATGQAATIFSTDFNSATVGAYANDAIINSGIPNTDDLKVRNTLGTGGTTLGVPEVVTVSGTNQALRITRSDSTNALWIHNNSTINSAWSTVSTDATGNNKMTVSFDLKRLNVGDANPVANVAGFRFLLGQAETSSSTVTGVDFIVRAKSGTDGGIVRYQNGSTLTTLPTSGTGSVRIDLETNYRFDFNVDLSNATQDTWDFKITNLDTSSVIYTSGTLNTRLANVLPTHAVWNFSDVDGGNVDSDPGYLLDNLNVAAVPEPASLGLIGAAGLLAMRRRRH